MQILALDVATTTGWARWNDSVARPTFGTQNSAGEVGEASSAFRTWLRGKIIAEGIEEIAIEAPVPQAGATNLNTLMRSLGAHCTVAALCHEHGLQMTPVNVGTWRHHFIGGARAPNTDPLTGKPLDTPAKRRTWLKKRVIAECQSRGWSVKSDDAADALGLLDYVRSLRDPSYAIKQTPLFQEAA